MHVDGMHFSSPRCAADVLQALLPSLTDAGLSLAVPGDSPVKLFRHPEFSSASVRVASRGAVSTFGVSGMACEALRLSGAFQGLLWAVSEIPHRVTRLEVARDLVLDSPAVLARMRRVALDGGYALTRKAVPASKVRFEQRATLYDSPHSTTGTLYLGHRRTAEAMCRVYDKRNQLIDTGQGDPGPLLRFELVVSGKLGPSLADCSDPAPIFAHFMKGVCGSLVDLSGVGPWVAGGVGYDIARPPDVRTPMQRFDSLLEKSPDIAHLQALVAREGLHSQIMAARHAALKFLPPGTKVEFVLPKSGNKLAS